MTDVVPDTPYPVLCAGPGPHDPPDGVIAYAATPGTTAGLCPPCAAKNDTAVMQAWAAQVLAGTNAATLRQQAVAALAGNITFLAVTGPTNAQVVAQVKALTRQVNALIRIVGDALDSIAGT